MPFDVREISPLIRGERLREVEAQHAGGAEDDAVEVREWRVRSREGDSVDGRLCALARRLDRSTENYSSFRQSDLTMLFLKENKTKTGRRKKIMFFF